MKTIGLSAFISIVICFFVFHVIGDDRLSLASMGIIYLFVTSLITVIVKAINKRRQHEKKQ